MALRIHITGASGSGVSSLARELATQLSSQAFDTDDFYWRPTDPPFQVKRPIPERLRLMEDLVLPRSDWILAGSLHTWGAPAMPRVTHVVFLTLDTDRRLDRLSARERQRLGSLIGKDGPIARQHREFMEWAAGYDEPGSPGRNRAAHEAWLAELPQPVIRLTSDSTPAQLAAKVLDALDGAPTAN